MTIGSSSYMVDLPDAARDRDERTVISRVRSSEEKRAHASSTSFQRTLRAYSSVEWCSSCRRQTESSYVNWCCEKNQRTIPVSCCLKKDYRWRRRICKIFLKKYLDFCLMVLLALLVQNYPSCLEAASISGAKGLSMAKRSAKEEPYWINPCEVQKLPDSVKVTEQDIQKGYKSANISVNSILSQAEALKEFPVESLSVSWEIASSMFFNNGKYHWLNIENSDSTELPVIYRYLQILAAALDLARTEMEENDDRFAKEISETEIKLRGLLCEIKLVMTLKGETPLPDISKDFIPKTKKISITRRLGRDFLILQQYLRYISKLGQILTKKIDDYEHLSGDVSH